MNGDKESVEEWHLGKCQTELHVEVLHVSLIMSLNIGDIFDVHLNEHRHKFTKITCTPPHMSIFATMWVALGYLNKIFGFSLPMIKISNVWKTTY